ncbi:hypothetical protein MY3296_010166 [Beauveria thailandica]
MPPAQRNASTRRSTTNQDGTDASDTKPLPVRSKVRFAHYEPPDARRHRREASRAPTSPLDTAWGALFGPAGDPTRRMGDILRGLATHLIEACPPNCSLVLEPDKMRRFYRQYRQRHEVVDWERLFTISDRSLETLYLELQCDYHLVQATGARPRRAASVPALTPQGFAHWSTLILGAFPGNEARRLQDVVADLPLEAVPQGPGQGHGQSSGPPCPRERLPRRISRCLFPDRANPDILRLVLRALSDAHSRGSKRYIFSAGASRQVVTWRFIFNNSMTMTPQPQYDQNMLVQLMTRWMDRDARYIRQLLRSKDVARLAAIRTRARAQRPARKYLLDALDSLEAQARTTTAQNLITVLKSRQLAIRGLQDACSTPLLPSGWWCTLLATNLLFAQSLDK